MPCGQNATIINNVEWEYTINQRKQFTNKKRFKTIRLAESVIASQVFDQSGHQKSNLNCLLQLKNFPSSLSKTAHFKPQKGLYPLVSEGKFNWLQMSDMEVKMKPYIHVSDRLTPIIIQHVDTLPKYGKKTLDVCRST